MKTFTLILYIMTMYVSVANAQWHYRTCGVLDINSCAIEEFECLWKNASNNTYGGAITFGVGTSFIVGGIIKSNRAHSGDMGAVFLGMFITSAGILMDLIGIPVLITGATRKDKLRNSPMFNHVNSGFLNISPTINTSYNNKSYYFGISVRCNF